MIAPDATTFAYLKGRRFSPEGAAWDLAVEQWRALVTDDGATFDRELHIDAATLVPTVTWGTNLYWASNDSALLTGAWWSYLPSGLCIAFVGFALVMLNTGFDEIANPRLRVERIWRARLKRRGSAGARSTPVVPNV